MQGGPKCKIENVTCWMQIFKGNMEDIENAT